MRKTLVLVGAILACVAVAPVASGAAGSEEAGIRKAETAWADAVKARDQAKLDGILADTLVYTHSTGIVEGKPQYLAKLKTGTQRYDDWKRPTWSSTCYGNAAVVAAKIHMTGATKGVPFNDRLLYTHVWVKQNGHWQLVAHQTTKAQ